MRLVLTISTTKLFLAEISLGDYNFHRWTSKPTEYYSVNSKPTCKPPELHTIMKKCNGTGLVLKICETKNNVWKKYGLSIQNSIDNYIKITKIKLDSASLNNPHNHKSPVFWCATRQVDKLNNENFFFPGTVYVPGCLCNAF